MCYLYFVIILEFKNLQNRFEFKLESKTEKLKKRKRIETEKEEVTYLGAAHLTKAQHQPSHWPGTNSTTRPVEVVFFLRSKKQLAVDLPPAGRAKIRAAALDAFKYNCRHRGTLISLHLLLFPLPFILSMRPPNPSSGELERHEWKPCRARRSSSGAPSCFQ
jgi:hypothetical protein